MTKNVQILTNSHGSGGLLMVLGAACFTINDALCKWLTPQYPVGQIIAVRSAGILILLGVAAVISRSIYRQLHITDYKLHAIRAGLFALAVLLFVSGLARMPLTNAIALSFTSPLFVVLLAGRVLGERVARSAWITVGVGFAGTVLILDPSIKEFGWVSVLPAVAAMVSATTDLMTRQMIRRESSLSLVMSASIGALGFGLCTAAFGWRSGDPGSLGLMGLIALPVLLSQYFIAEAFRRGPASYIAPFRYSAIIWSIAIAFLVWDQTPNSNVLIGSAVVIGSGWYLARRRSIGS